jgi:ubiquinone biosynthesis protein Coq4
MVKRFQALAELPDGTLGREYVRYREHNGFPWPGEKGGIPEGGVHHDFTHVLTGYATDPLGEIQIGAFTAGMKKTDPFMFLFFPMLEFHVGLAIRPGTPSFPGHYDAALAFKAHQAGSRCARDLTDHWDFWSVVDRPVASLRDEYRIAT